MRPTSLCAGHGVDLVQAVGGDFISLQEVRVRVTHQKHALHTLFHKYIDVWPNVNGVEAGNPCSWLLCATHVARVNQQLQDLVAALFTLRDGKVVDVHEGVGARHSSLNHSRRGRDLPFRVCATFIGPGTPRRNAADVSRVARRSMQLVGCLGAVLLINVKRHNMPA